MISPNATEETDRLHVGGGRKLLSGSPTETLSSGSFGEHDRLSTNALAQDRAADPEEF